MFPKTCPVCKHETIEHDELYVYCTNCPAYRHRIAWYKRPVVWVMARTGWWWRLPILLLFVAILISCWQDPKYAITLALNPLIFVNAGVHEIGHYVFIPFGEFMRIAGGSIFQCLLPLLGFVGFLQIRYYFAAALTWCWLGLNFYSVAEYAGDAQARTATLIGPGSIVAAISGNTDEAYDEGHDWYQLLTRTGTLQHDQAIAQFIRSAGDVVFIFGLALGALIIIGMIIASFKKWRETRAAKSST